MRNNRRLAGSRLGVATLALISVGVLAACGGAKGATTAGTERPPTVPAGGTEAPAGTPTTQSGRPLAGKVITIDPGHNGANGDHPALLNRKVNIINQMKECDTTGAEAHGYTEHAFNWDVSVRLQKILEADGAKVVMTRADDTTFGPCINERAAIGNRARSDAALSIHADGPGTTTAHGFHIIEPALLKGHNDAVVGPSKKLGTDLRDAYHSGTGLPYSNYVGTDAINVRDDLGGLNLSTVPKVFIECGSMDNAGDFAKLHDPAFRQRIAQSLAEGFITYFQS